MAAHAALLTATSSPATNVRLVLRQIVDSASLRSIGYDRATRTLEVEFKSGGIYRYDDFPSELWSEFRRAESKGRFFQERVRDQFSTERV